MKRKSRNESRTGRFTMKRGSLVVLVLVAFVFCAGVLLSAADGRAQVPDKVRIGLMFGLTGAASPIGPVQLDGAKLAIKEINAAGGVKFGAK
jgi:branched-chain amino acid transport system substrate-binding protein